METLIGAHRTEWAPTSTLARKRLRMQPMCAHCKTRPARPGGWFCSDAHKLRGVAPEARGLGRELS